VGFQHIAAHARIIRPRRVPVGSMIEGCKNIMI